MPSFRRSIPVMGTVATVEIADPLPAERLADLAGRVFAWLREVDQRFSTYRYDSEISRLERRALALADCSADVRGVLDRCAALWRETDGYFDVYATGRLDPSGYVKGWSVEVASALLSRGGAGNHLVDAGGDIQTRGYDADGGEWRIGVRHPWQPDRLSWVLHGTDLAVATSGTYERGPHVIDPRTGRPAEALRSVTVVGRELGVADAYATAALAMGEAGLGWLAGLAHHDSGVVTADGRCYRSARLPVLTAS